MFACFFQRYLRSEILYPVEYWMRMIKYVLKVIAMIALWTALFVNQTDGDMSRVQMVTYGVFGAIFAEILGSGDIRRYIGDQIASGRVEHDLLKPVNLQLHLFFRDAARRLVLVMTCILPLCCVVCMIVPMYTPNQPLTWLLSFISLLMAYLLLFMIDFLFSLTYFLTLSLRGIFPAYTAVVGFLSGQWFPLWYMPQWAQNVLHWLPFRGLYDTPASIWIGRINTEEAIFGIIVQCMWLVVLMLGGQLYWRSIQRRIILQGG